MPIALRVGMVLLVLSLLGVFSFSLKKDTTPSNALTTTPRIEQIMLGVHAERFDSNGRLSQIINMDSWFSHQGATISYIQKPALSMHQSNGDIWHITAEKGQGYMIPLNGKIEQLDLSENVLIRAEVENARCWTLQTQALTFFPQQLLAITEEKVKINGPDMHIWGLGLKANLQNHQIELLKNVKTHYAKSKI